MTVVNDTSPEVATGTSGNGTSGNGTSTVHRPFYTMRQRILRGYGPVAAIVLVLVLVAVLVPSKAGKSNNVAASGEPGGGSAQGTEGANVTGGPAAPGAATQTGAAAQA